MNRTPPFNMSLPSSSEAMSSALPTFAGRVDPDAYLVWERRMEYIFEYYRYNERKKIVVATAQLTEFALSWWNHELERRRSQLGYVETWTKMKQLLKRRFVPEHYHRTLRKRFGRLNQGSRSVQEYYEELEYLEDILELNYTEEELMIHFVDGLQERILRNVEGHQCRNFHELLHLAIKVEQQLNRKAPLSNRGKLTPNWTPQAIVSTSKTCRPEPPKLDVTIKSHDIRCFKCQGRGHTSYECPNKRVIIITDNGGYESQDEYVGESKEQDELVDEAGDQEESIEYADVGEWLDEPQVLEIQTKLSKENKMSNSNPYISPNVIIESLNARHTRPLKACLFSDFRELWIPLEIPTKFITVLSKENLANKIKHYSRHSNKHRKEVPYNDEIDLRTNPSEEGGNDEDLLAPTIPSPPMSRSMTKKLQEEFNTFTCNGVTNGLVLMELVSNQQL